MASMGVYLVDSDIFAHCQPYHSAHPYGRCQGTMMTDVTTINQQILAAIKFGVSQNKVIWQLLNLASLRGPSIQCTINVRSTYMLAANISENTQFAKFAKYNSTPKFVDLQYVPC